MHIPDGFLDTKTAAVTAALALATVAVAARRIDPYRQARSVPTMGLAAAFIFVAQMINFPIGAGTSGHLMGGALAAVLLGPPGAILALTAVLVVQCFLFADGGLLALGANVLNIAVVAPVSAFVAYRLVRMIVAGTAGLLTAAAFGGWCSTVAASVTCASQLAWSGTSPWGLTLPAMSQTHMIIGIAEGAITALVLAGVLRTRPELLAPGESAAANGGAVFPYVLLLLLSALVLLTPFASSLPDGLEQVASRLGFAGRAAEWGAGPMADYRIPWIPAAHLATVTAGAVGAIVAFALSYALGKILARERGGG